MTQEPRSQDPPDGGRLLHPANTDYNPWNWLLLIPIVLPVLVFMYNTWTPKLGGFPFFFWWQIMFTLLAAAVSGLVFVLTKQKQRS
jgi:Protein of unknown function (DUF3311)